MPATPRWRAAGLAAGIAVAGAAVSWPPHARAEEAGPTSSVLAGVPARRTEEPKPRPVGVMINGRLSPEQALIVAAGGEIYMRRADFEQSGLSPFDLPAALVVEEQAYVSLSAIADLTASLGDGGGVLEIAASPAIFPAARFERSAQQVQLDEIVPAAFISYDLTFTRWNGQNSAFAFLDAGVSGAWGLVGTTIAMQSAGRGAVRLDSYFKRDWLDERVRLVIGDTVTRATEWSAPAQFAGIRVGTDFSLQPTLVAFPLPTLTESATLPSTLELMSLAGSQTLSVQPGAFAIDYLPVFSGAGEVTMTITDINGLSRQVTRSFYTSPRLLQPGLFEFSAEAGVVRENYGTNSFDYGAPFAAGFLRFGLNRALTVGGRVEVSPHIQMGGTGVGWVLSPIGEFGLAGAVSDSPWGTGTLWRAQFQRIAPTHSFTLSYQKDNGRLAQIGDVRLDSQYARQPRRELAVAGSLSLGAVGEVIVGHAETRTAAGQNFRATTFSLTGDMGAAFYNLGFRRNRFGDRTDSGAFLSVSMPLGARRSASFRVDGQRTLAMIGSAPPNDLGAGFQFAAGYDAVADQPIIDASSLIRTTAGEVELAGGRNSSGQGIRVSTRGAFLAVAGKVVATPRLENAFALVELDSEDDVTLYLENRPVVAKGGTGKTAILTGLQPYAQNRIAFDISSLPITANVDIGERLVVPGFRQAVRVDFGGSTQSAVTVKLVDAQGVPLSPGLEVRAVSGDAGFTGYDGLAFLADLTGGERLSVGNRTFRCEAQIPTSPKIDEKRQLGPIVCLPTEDLELIP